MADRGMVASHGIAAAHWNRGSPLDHYNPWDSGKWSPCKIVDIQTPPASRIGEDRRSLWQRFNACRRHDTRRAAHAPSPDQAWRETGRSGWGAGVTGHRPKRSLSPRRSRSPGCTAPGDRTPSVLLSKLWLPYGRIESRRILAMGTHTHTLTLLHMSPIDDLPSNNSQDDMLQDSSPPRWPLHKHCNIIRESLPGAKSELFPHFGWPNSSKLAGVVAKLGEFRPSRWPGLEGGAAAEGPQVAVEAARANLRAFRGGRTFPLPRRPAWRPTLCPRRGVWAPVSGRRHTMSRVPQKRRRP